MNPAATSSSLSLNLRTLQLGGPLGWVDVSDVECRLLQALASEETQRLDTAKILGQLGKQMDDYSKVALVVQIVRLRKKLKKAGASTPTIKAIRGMGYQLCVAMEIHPPA